MSRQKKVKQPERTRKFRPDDAEPEQQGYRPRILDNPPAPVKLFLAMPTRDMIPAEFMYDLTKMVALVSSTLVADGAIELGMNMVQSTAIHVGRQDLAEQALRTGATHMLWLDTDHTFPAESLFQALSHIKRMEDEKFFVGANYSTRKFPPRAVAFKHVRQPYATMDEDVNVSLYTLPTSSGLEEVDAVGFGFVLMPTQIFRDIGEDAQYFMFAHDPENPRRWCGEDVYFCRLAREAGWKIMVDHDLSQEMGHLGTFKFHNAHAAFVVNEEMERNGTGDVLRPAVGDFDMARAQRLDERSD